MSVKEFSSKLEDKTFTITDNDGEVVFVDGDFPWSGSFTLSGNYPYFLLESDQGLWIFINCLSSTRTPGASKNANRCLFREFGVSSSSVVRCT